MKRISLILALLVAVFTLRLSAQTDLITAEEYLALTKAGEKMVVVDANKAKAYAASHLKDAIHINHNDLYQEGTIEGLVKSPEEMAAFFAANGIGENTPVVIYDDGSQKYSNRLYWILKYIGANNVRMLHRDLEAWKKVRLPLSTTPAKLAPVEFKVQVRPELFASLEYLKSRKDAPDFVLVDVRTPAEFNGTVENSKGHIPGAVNLNHEDLITPSGAFKPVEELRKLAEAKGISPDKEIVFYCRTSVRGTVAFVAFKNLMGYERVKVYDGAYLEWVANENPIVQ